VVGFVKKDLSKGCVLLQYFLLFWIIAKARNFGAPRTTLDHVSKVQSLLERFYSSIIYSLAAADSSLLSYTDTVIDHLSLQLPCHHPLAHCSHGQFARENTAVPSDPC